MRFPFPKEWRAACQLTDELRERFLGIGFGIAEAGSGQIVIDIFGANTSGKADQILDEVHFAKHRVGIVGDVEAAILRGPAAASGGRRRLPCRVL